MGIDPYYDHAGITIFHGDCREILPQLEPVDLVLTDPPYGIGYDRIANSVGGKRSINGAAWKTDHDTTGWDDEAVPDGLLQTVIDFGNRAIVWGGNYYSLPPSRCWLFWDKMNDGKTFADGELAWTNLSGSVRRLQHLWDGMLQQKMGDKKESRLHPTQKPLSVIRWCMTVADKTATANTILDPFMGSGTTLRAAKDLGRKAIGIEIEEKYCEIAANRLRQEVLF